MEQDNENLEGFDHFSEVSEEDYDITSVFKIIFLGDSGVGKTNLMKRFSEDQFFFNSKPTIGVDFRTKIVKINNHVIKLQIWDTAGQERYKSFTKAYFKDCKGILMVYDITSRKSFDNLENWFGLADEQSKVDNLPIVLIGNKTDLDERRLVPTLEGEDTAEQRGTGFIETSAYSNRGDCVGKAFYLLLKRIMDHPDLFKEEEHIAKPARQDREEEELQLPPSLMKDNKMDPVKQTEKKKGGCC